MATREIISKKSRNLGYGWTNNVVQGDAGLRIATEQIKCDAQGGPATVQREIADARRINSGNDWAGALFVGGRRVVRVIEPSYLQGASEIMQAVGEGECVTVEVE